jgi:hypothetical protein
MVAAKAVAVAFWQYSTSELAKAGAAGVGFIVTFNGARVALSQPEALV